MRISTAMIYSTGVETINNLQANLSKAQQQISSGTRVLNPSDDPVAAARALETTTAQAVSSMEESSQGTASDSLKYLDSKLSSITDVLQYVRERAIQAGNGSLSTDDLEALASDLQAQYDSLLSLANSKDSSGVYMFSGYQGGTQPFVGNLASVTYEGDQGERSIQVSSSRLMPVSVNGYELFMNIASGNGTFTTSTTSTSAVISDGTLTGYATYSGTQYGIKFTSATTYDVYDLEADPTMTGTTSPPLIASGLTYTSGEAITLPDPTDASTAELIVKISGTPATGDTFTVVPGDSADMFTTLRELIVGLTATSGTNFSDLISDSIARLDNALSNVSSLQSAVGSREVELDALTAMNGQVNVQLADRLDRLVGLDYASAISTYTQEQTSLQAALGSFSKVSGLSLFNYIN